MLTLPCPQCNQALSLPDRFAGKSTKCPACQHTFVAPGGPDTAQSVAEMMDAAKPGSPPPGDAAVAPSDRLAVEALMEQAGDREPPPPKAAVEVCPGCGAKWKLGESTCPKCRYNIYAAKKVRPPVREKLLPDVRFGKLLLYALAAALFCGAYWLYDNFSDLRHKGLRIYDDASRTKIEELDAKVSEQQGSVAGQPTIAGKPTKVAVLSGAPKLDDMPAPSRPGNVFVVVTLALVGGEIKELTPDDYLIADPQGKPRKPLGFKPAPKVDFETLSRHLVPTGGTLRIGKGGAFEADSLDLLYEVPAQQPTLELRCGAKRFTLKLADGTVDAAGN